jgi:ABC-type uncharacterized transport system ATPase subunit
MYSGCVCSPGRGSNDSGVLGAEDCHGRRLRRRLDYLPEERVLYKKEKILDVMACFGRLQRYSS